MYNHAIMLSRAGYTPGGLLVYWENLGGPPTPVRYLILRSIRA